MNNHLLTRVPNDQCERRVDEVRSPRQAPQHARRHIRRARFTENLGVNFDHRIGSEDRLAGHPARDLERLFPGGAARECRGVFSSTRSLFGLSGDDLEGYADELEKLAPAWRTAGQDEVIFGHDSDSVG
jgi:hypothetical protein